MKGIDSTHLYKLTSPQTAAAPLSRQTHPQRETGSPRHNPSASLKAKPSKAPRQRCLAAAERQQPPAPVPAAAPIAHAAGTPIKPCDIRPVAAHQTHNGDDPDVWPIAPCIGGKCHTASRVANDQRHGHLSPESSAPRCRWDHRARHAWFPAHRPGYRLRQAQAQYTVGLPSAVALR